MNPKKKLITEKSLGWLIILVLLTGLFLNLAVQPVFLEEPRRAIIAMEMLASGNFINPTFLGTPYTMKPPMFNWLLALSMSVISDPVLALRVPTVLSLISMGILFFWAGKKYVSQRFGWVIGLSVVTANGFLFYFSLIGEIDLFYALVTIISFLSLFHFFEKEKYLHLFLWTYFFGAIGFLTKGFPSVVFLALSIPIPFLLFRRFKLLFSWKHLMGILTFGLIVGTYFYFYEKNMPTEKLVEGIWSQASDRTLLKNNLSKLLLHVLYFPVETLLNLFPGILLLIFAFQKKALFQIKKNRFVLFALVLLFINFIVYWISPGTRQRYVFMLYPLILIPGVYFFTITSSGKWQHKTLKWIASGLALVLIIGAIMLNFIAQLDFLTYILPMSLIFVFIFLGIFIGTFLKPNYSFFWILLLFAFTRIAFDLTSLPERDMQGLAFEDKKMAYDIHEIVGDESLSIYKKGMISMTTLYYLNVLREDKMVRNDNAKQARFWIVRADLAPELPGFKKWYDIDFNNQSYFLVELLE